jgi:gliding motility-associated-like protein
MFKFIIKAKAFILLIIILLSINIINAQSGKWTWMHGDQVGSSTSNYGTLGVPAATNLPPARYQTAYWQDLDGNFWIFGGVTNVGDINDLWKFDPNTVMWTWMGGAQNATNTAGNYGPVGVPGANYYPSGRGFGANCWTDKNNNLWLYGGTNSGDDLWKYNIAANEWTLVKGSNVFGITQVLGTQGVASPTNSPGVINETKSGYVDENNNLWMIGNGTEILWKYLMASNEWVWMKGDPAGTSANYGVKNVEASTNQPSARYSYTKWKDLEGNFYIFAGLSIGSTFGNLNDVWKYNPTTNNWTWVAGTNIGDDPGTNPASCKPSVTDAPFSRYENQTVSTTGCTNAFWSFGGFTSGGSANDLWLYDAKLGTFTYASGSLTPGSVGNYGTLGTYSPTNMIPSRGGVGIWTDKNDNLWIFGGYATTFILANDMWKYEPDTSCIKTPLSLSFALAPLTDSIKCGNQKITYPITDANNIILVPNTGYTFNNDSTQITFNNTSSTTYTLIAESNGPCPGKDTLVFNIIVDPIPDAQINAYPEQAIINNPNFSFSSTGPYTAKYEWYYNNVLVSTAKDYNTSFNTLGQHCLTLVAFNNEGCTDTTIKCVTIVPDIKITFPNAFSPNGDGKNDIFKPIVLNIDKCDFKVFNRYGNEVFATNSARNGWDGKHNGEMCDIGTYFYKFEYKDYTGKNKVIRGDINLVR